MVSGRRSALFMPLIAGIAYVVLTIAVVLLLSFPGFGVSLLPQPLLRVAVLGKTVSYDLTNIYVVFWVMYSLAIHLVLYLAITRLVKFSRPYVQVSVLLYVINLALVLAGLSDENLVRLVKTYTIGYAGIIPGIGVTVLAEWLGYRLSCVIGERITKI